MSLQEEYVFGRAGPILIIIIIVIIFIIDGEISTHFLNLCLKWEQGRITQRRRQVHYRFVGQRLIMMSTVCTVLEVRGRDCRASQSDVWIRLVLACRKHHNNHVEQQINACHGRC